MKMGHGGARPGAGKPVGSKMPATISKELAREALRQIVLQHMERMTSAQVANACGLSYMVLRDKATGKFLRLGKDALEKLVDAGSDALERVEIWEKDPSTPAYTDLMNRAMDKPKEQEQDIKHSGGLTIVHEIPE